MKWLTLLIFIMGCQSSKERAEIFNAVPGIYIRYSDHEFGIECDTLVIKIINRQDQFFSIERRWMYQRILDGKKLPRDYKLIKNTGRYLSGSNQIRNNESGDHYYFHHKLKIIINGSIQYRKL